MSDWVLLIAVACALYLIECSAWIKSSECVFFKHPLSRTWRATKGDQLPGNERGGFVLVDPLGLAGGLVVSHPWPFSMDAKGVTNLAPDGTTGGTRARYIPFDTIVTIREELGEIRINDRRLVGVGSSVAARFWTGQIERVRRRPVADREPEIRAAIAATLDHEQAGTSWAAFDSGTRFLQRLSWSLLVFAFVVAPLVVFLIGPYPSWMYLLAGVFGIALMTAVVFFRTHASLYPPCSYDRWVHTLAMVLLPISAIRCADRLARDALCQYNPAVIVPAIGDLRGAATPFLRKQLMDLRNPLGSSGLDESSAEAVRCAEWFRHTLTADTEAALDRVDVDVFAPPVREDRSMASYCPRCHTQFTKADGDCSECPGIQVVSFDGMKLSMPGHA